MIADYKKTSRTRWAGAMLFVAVLACVVLTNAYVAKADFIFGTSTNLGPTINSPHSDVSGSFSSDGLEMYFDSNRSGGSMKDNIYVSTRATTYDSWATPVELDPPVNSSALDGCPVISTDGLALYFMSVRAGGYGGLDIWVTTRETMDDEWGEPFNLGPKVNGPQDDIPTSVSFDGLTLYLYSRNRLGGYGDYDIWVSTRQTKDSDWSEPMNLGPTVNSSYSDGGPRVTADGLSLFFHSNRPGGFGNHDIYMTTRATTDDDWGIPINLGPPINTSAVEGFPTILPDGSNLCFTSDQPGGMGGRDLWKAPILPIVDFNGDGNIDTDDLVILVNCWGLNIPLCDIGPTPLGDGIVDMEDLKVFMSYWEQENMTEVP